MRFQTKNREIIEIDLQDMVRHAFLTMVEEEVSVIAAIMSIDTQDKIIGYLNDTKQKHSIDYVPYEVFMKMITEFELNPSIPKCVLAFIEKDFCYRCNKKDESVRTARLNYNPLQFFGVHYTDSSRQAPAGFSEQDDMTQPLLAHPHEPFG